MQLLLIPDKQFTFEHDVDMPTRKQRCAPYLHQSAREGADISPRRGHADAQAKLRPLSPPISQGGC